MNKSAGAAAPAAPAEKPKKEKKKKAASGGGGGGGLTPEEVAKHTTKEDCWVILHGNVLNVTSFLSQHPGGELAILTFAGKDATAEFDMIHPPDVIGKYAPDACIGKLGEGGGDEEEDDDVEAGADVPQVGQGQVASMRKSITKARKPADDSWSVAKLREGLCFHCHALDG